MNEDKSQKIQLTYDNNLKENKSVTLHELWKDCLPSSKFEIRTIFLMSLILFFTASFASMLGFIYQVPDFLCYKNNNGIWEYLPCTENEACSTYKNNFKIDNSRFVSLITDFNLICNKNDLKNVSMNLVLFFAPFASFYASIHMDYFGRRNSFICSIFFVILGVLLCLIFNNLWSITAGITILDGYSNIMFTIIFLYTNEILTDPLRSKAPGIQAMSFSIGQVSKQFI